jgi:Fe2+ or Zn2+ uptake regulation protein
MAIKMVLEKLKAHGYKLTPQRIKLIHILAEVKKPTSAGEIYQKAREFFPGISQETVYRNLKLLTNLGLVSNSNISNRNAEAFEISNHHHHLVCLACSKVICLDICPLEANAILPETSTHSFKVVSHTLEFYGYCARCNP